MYHVVEVHERVVDRDDLDIGVVHGGAQHNAANAAKAVEGRKANVRAQRDSGIHRQYRSGSLYFH